MRGESKSRIDYVLADEETAAGVTHMTIDESEEKWGIGADHCWIEVGLQLCLKLNKVNEKSFRWNITNATDGTGTSQC